jgi:hypothetical protein
VNQLLALLVMYLAMAAYLRFAGVAVGMIQGILITAAKFALISAALVASIPMMFSLATGANVFLITAIFCTLYMLPVTAISRARDHLLPKSSVLTVVCLNVMVILLGRPFGGFAMFEQLLGFVQQMVLNPFVLLIPKPLSWLNTVISLWPSLLAMALAARGAAAGRPLRFVLMLWVQIILLVWLVPVSLTQVMQPDSGSFMGLVDLLLASLSLVHVVITWMMLRDAVTGERTTLVGETSEDSTEKIGVARRLADGMSEGPWPPQAYVVAAIATWLAVRVMFTYLQDAQPALWIFMGIIGAGPLSSRVRKGELAKRSPKLVWLASWAVVAVALVGVGGMNILPGYWARETERFATQHGYNMSSPVAVASTRCAFTSEPRLGLRCADGFSPLASLQHPADLEPPAGMKLAPDRVWDINRAGQALQCQEFEVSAGNTEQVFVLMFAHGADQATQYAWSMEPDGHCYNFIAVTYKDDPTSRTSLEYRWNPGSNRSRRSAYSPVGWLHPLPVSDKSREEQGPEAEQRREPDAVGESSEDHAG